VTFLEIRSAILTALNADPTTHHKSKELCRSVMEPFKDQFESKSDRKDKFAKAIEALIEKNKISESDGMIRLNNNDDKKEKKHKKRKADNESLEELFMETERSSGHKRKHHRTDTSSETTISIEEKKEKKNKKRKTEKDIMGSTEKMEKTANETSEPQTHHHSTETLSSEPTGVSTVDINNSSSTPTPKVYPVPTGNNTILLFYAYCTPQMTRGKSTTNQYCTGKQTDRQTVR
jgi:hypothetical protein